MKQFLATLIVSLLIANSAYNQEPKRITRTLSMDDAVIIRELGAVIVPKNEKLVVEIILGNHEKENAEIQKDDRVVMANGKKVKSIKDLREQYEKAAVGEQFKLGVQRGDNLQIAEFVKKSEEELNKEGNRGGMVMRMERKEGEAVLPALGLIVMTKGSTVIVSKTLPNLNTNFKSFVPKEDDVILTINGQSVSTAEDFDEAYTDLKQGDNVTIEFSRNGKTSKETFSKPKPMGRMIMKQ